MPFAAAFDNKDTCTPAQERREKGYSGLMPIGEETFSVQLERAVAQLRSKTTPLEKYCFMSWLRNTNTRLAYALILTHLEEITPIIYTPTVGEACQKYSEIYPFLAPPRTADGLFLPVTELDKIEEMVENYRREMPADPNICVITDGSRILGLGDLGMNGMGISVGKLQLYIAAAGIDPKRVLPICVDFGTDRKSLLQSPFYLGLRQARPTTPPPPAGTTITDKAAEKGREGSPFHKVMDKVLDTLNKRFPEMLIQFEDFSTEHAFQLLARHVNNYCCFNDDIQGTGAVILSGFVNAVREVGRPLKEHRILFFGAGSAAVGVAKQLVGYFIKHGKMSEEEAKSHFWLVDSKGLVTLNRGDRLAAHKIFFARKEEEFHGLSSQLDDIIRVVSPTCLIGLSSQSGAFSPHVLQLLADINAAPVVFPLSNPATQAECTYEDAMVHTNGRVIFASGTAFPPYKDPTSDEMHYPGQGNNMYIFPGLGLAAILAQATRISDEMIVASAMALADSVSEEERKAHSLYPALTRIRQVSAHVAARVILTAHQQGLIRNAEAQKLSAKEGGEAELVEWVKKQMWDPLN